MRNDFPPCGSDGVPLSVDDPARLGTLRSYAVMGTAREAAFDDISVLAQIACDAPVALVSLVESSRQWFKAASGTDLRQTPIDTSICAFTLERDEVLVVPDTLADPRFARMSVVTELGMRFYAGAPLRSPDGFGLGALCVLDTVPRTLTDVQRRQLSLLAGQVMAQLELRRSLVQTERALHAHRQLMSASQSRVADPLMRIELALHHVERLPDLTDVDREQLATAKDDHRAVAATLRRIAQASLLDRRTIGIAPERVADLLERLRGQWRERAAKDGRILEIQGFETSFETNAELVSLILDALVANAFDHGTGTVRVESGPMPRGLWIAVTDGGPGVDRATEARIGAALGQAQSGDRGGLGVGLSIAQRAAELLGADLSLHSEPGVLTRFLLRLPEHHRNTVNANDPAAGR